MARVHPGETVSSWVMKGALDFISSDHEDAEFIRNNFIIKVIPMINPDGVICGNFRTSIAGADLNRRWKNPSENLFPEILNTKEMISKMANERNVDLVVDMHGHSGQYNIFIYGNYIKGQPRVTKLYPYLLGKNSDCFFYSLCKFKMQKFKRGTARLSIFNDIGPLPNVVTIEASVAGTNSGKFKNLHWNSQRLMTMGRDVFKGFIHYLHAVNHKFVINPKYSNNYNPDKENKEKNKLPEKKPEYKYVETELEQYENDILKENEELGLGNSDSESGGSDSEPSGDNFELDQLAKYLPLKRAREKKKKKTTKISSKMKLKKENDKKIEEFKEKVVKKTIEKPKEVRSSIINVNINIDKTLVVDDKKKGGKIDAETQTEEIFFKFPWTFFKNKYKIITASARRHLLENNMINNNNYIPNSNNPKHNSPPNIIINRNQNNNLNNANKMLNNNDIKTIQGSHGNTNNLSNNMNSNNNLPNFSKNQQNIRRQTGNLNNINNIPKMLNFNNFNNFNNLNNNSMNNLNKLMASQQPKKHHGSVRYNSNLINSNSTHNNLNNININSSNTNLTNLNYINQIQNNPQYQQQMTNQNNFSPNPNTNKILRNNDKKIK